MSYNSRKVKEVIAEECACFAHNLIDDTTLESLGNGYLDNLDLAIELEDEFGIKLPDDAADGFITVGDVVKCIDRLVNVEEV